MKIPTIDAPCPFNFTSGVNISHENQNYSKPDPKNLKTYPNIFKKIEDKLHRF